MLPVVPVEPVEPVAVEPVASPPGKVVSVEPVASLVINGGNVVPIVGGDHSHNAIP